MSESKPNDLPGRPTEYELRVWGDGDIVESGRIPASQLADRLRRVADIVWADRSRCPGCFSRLEWPLKAMPDGMVPCPECGTPAAHPMAERDK